MAPIQMNKRKQTTAFKNENLKRWLMGIKKKIRRNSRQNSIPVFNRKMGSFICHCRTIPVINGGNNLMKTDLFQKYTADALIRKNK